MHATHRHALDALGLIVTAPMAWQATTGLRWVEELIGGNFRSIVGRSWRLPDWLEELRTSGQLKPPETAVLQRMIDGLAARGDSRAVALQRAHE